MPWWISSYPICVSTNYFDSNHFHRFTIHVHVRQNEETIWSVALKRAKLKHALVPWLICMAYNYIWPVKKITIFTIPRTFTLHFTMYHKVVPQSFTTCQERSTGARYTEQERLVTTGIVLSDWNGQICLFSRSRSYL